MLIDLRSDTITKPTKEMREAMFSAEVGDDVYQEDPSVNKLEERAADMLGKEAALFVTSGTQGNQLAVLAHCRPAQEIIVEQDSHIVFYEGAAISALAGVQPRSIIGNRGEIDPHHLEQAIRPKDIHFPVTGLICLENTHNRAGGAIVSLQNMQHNYDIARRFNIPLHLDGARLFNAAVATGHSLQSFASYTDSVQVCLSKGLGAPVGSILAGKKDFIEEARIWRKRLGGGWRQAGMLAAAGEVALTTMVERLADDNEHAALLARGLAEIDGISLVTNPDTNIVLVTVEKENVDAASFLEALKKNDILASAFGTHTVRFTTNYHIEKSDITTVIDKIAAIMS